ncbi:hypothetical protein PPACK8108_LOCUS21268 [Phakopsora pachyrhizi]|uniref:Uncharacterized protein n=1 Tax=Phakopsora pachyrhizi TaxID=170000 RepID=A0AAV0BHA1_PHAPC|nr:hypothetical protein PPACK8108_LOCUS21268 [Phakopsora pachyrhizi]
MAFYWLRYWPNFLDGLLSSLTAQYKILNKVVTLYQLRSQRTSHLPSGNLKRSFTSSSVRLPKSLTNLSSDTEDSKYHTDSASYNPGNPSGSGTELTSPEVEASISDVEHQIVYLTSQNHIPDQINCSSDWSHLQQTFHLSSNPLRMYNSSLSSASSSTDSWDFDPDLIIPDGPLPLLQSDSKNNTEDSSVSSSIQSTLISSNGAYSTQTTTTTDLNHSSSSQSVRPRTDDSEHDLHQLGCFESEDEDEEQGEETVCSTTSSTNSGRVKAAVSSNALSLAAPSPHSLKPPWLRTKSLKHTSSDPKIGDDHRPQSRLQH